MVEVKADNKQCFYNIQQYLTKRVYLKYAIDKDKAVIQRLASKFTSHQGELYRRTSNGMQLRCLNETEATKAMEEIHEGVCDPRMNRAILAKKLMRQGFFWITMMEDCIKFVRKCYKCQIHGDIIHLPSTSYTSSLLYGPSQYGG